MKRCLLFFACFIVAGGAAGKTGKGVPEPMAAILSFAGRAPSPCNTQPWRVIVTSPGECVVQSDRRRWLPALDPDNRETVLSLGAFCENLVRSAAALGNHAELAIVARTPFDTDVVRVAISSSPASGTSVLDAISNRTTDRGLFKTRPLSNEDLHTLTDVSKGRILFFPRGSDEGKWLAESLVAAGRQQVYADPKQRESAMWFRFFRSESAGRHDGMNAEMLALTGMSRYRWYHFMDRDSAMDASFRERMIKHTRSQVDNCAGFFIVTSGGTSVKNLIEAGRCCQRLLLAGHEQGVALHPMSQLLEEYPWKKEIDGRVSTRGPVQFIVRAGYSDNKREPAPRRPLNEWVRFEGQ